MDKHDENYHRTFMRLQLVPARGGYCWVNASGLPYRSAKGDTPFKGYQDVGGDLNPIDIHPRDDQNFWQYATAWERTFSTLCGSSSSREAVPVVDEHLTVIGHCGLFYGSKIFFRKGAEPKVGISGIVLEFKPGEPVFVRASAPSRSYVPLVSRQFEVLVAPDGAVRRIEGGVPREGAESTISPIDFINFGNWLGFVVSRVTFPSVRGCTLKSIEFKGRPRLQAEGSAEALAQQAAREAAVAGAGRTTSRGMGAVGPAGPVGAPGGIIPRRVGGRLELTIDEMGNHLAPLFQRNPEFVRLMQARALTGNALTREVRGSLDAWARRTGKQWEIVPQGHVQTLTGVRGNFASMQGNKLLIERQVLDSPPQFYEEVVHELASAAIGGRGVPHIWIAGNSTWNAQKILETWISNTGSFDWFRQVLAP